MEAESVNSSAAKEELKRELFTDVRSSTIPQSLEVAVSIQKRQYPEVAGKEEEEAVSDHQ